MLKLWIFQPENTRRILQKIIINASTNVLQIFGSMTIYHKIEHFGNNYGETKLTEITDTQVRVQSAALT